MHTPERDLPKNLHELIESLAENTYNIHARQRLANSKSRAARAATAFPPYEELPDAEKQDHRNTAIETLKLILNRGFKLEPPKPASPSEEGKGPKAAETATLALIDSVNLPSAIALWLAHDPDEWAHTPEIHRRLGRRVLKLGEPLLAYDILTEGLKNAPADVGMRQQVALSLARSGATQRSNAILTQLRAEGHRD
ncbi:MAG: RyR domain-containing protein, partial [Pyrinomonadaceae bacterium]